MKKPPRGHTPGISRRDLFTGAGLLGIHAAGLPILLPAVVAVEADAAAPQTEVPRAIETLTAQQFATLSAIAARIFPTDANGPGALEAHAANYIDRALNSHHSHLKDNYIANLAAVDACARAAYGQSFAGLSPENQDAVLTAIESNNVGKALGFVPDAKAFFNLVLEHTQEGMFSDPYYGGNSNFIGWDLLDFPGVKLEFSATEQQIDHPVAKAHRSAYSYVLFNGRKQ